MAGSEWIDAALSKEMPLLRDRGQHLEFMERCPENGYELGKEIAAFASSNPGTILIGVADDGSLAGNEEVATPEGRDRLCRRIKGVCSGNVRPAITPMVKFARGRCGSRAGHRGSCGTQPVYHCKHTPYVRHNSQSRPAEPHEVIERVNNSLARNPLTPNADEVGNSFLSSLAATLIEIVNYGGEFDKRNVNPWLELAGMQLGGAVEELRRLASEDRAVTEGIDGRLRSIADKLDAAASHRLTMGGESWRTLSGHVSGAVNEALQLKAEHVDTAPLSAEARQDNDDTITRSARDLSDLNRRAQAMANDGRVGELQEEASRTGHQLLVASHCEDPDQDDDFAARLRETEGHVPRHARVCRDFRAEYARQQQDRVAAFSEFRRDVASGSLPDESELVQISDEELNKFETALENWS